MTARIRSILPYVLGLAVAAALYVDAGHIAYTPRGDELGPTVWPRLALALMATVCLFEIVRKLAGGKADTRGIAETLNRESQAGAEPRHPRLIAGGIVLIAAYAVLLPILGFITATLPFLAVFMYLGRYRNHVAIWAASTVVTFFCGLLFLRIAYVSLPRGIEPFDRVADVFLLLPGL
jgi:uncharacterized protein involved in response to NO